MKKFLKVRISIVALVFMLAAFAVIAFFGTGSTDIPSTYYQTGGYNVDTGYSTLCYQLDYTIDDEEGKNKLESVWLNIGSIDYTSNDSAIVFKALLARSKTGSFKDIKTYNFTNSKSSPVSGKWVCVADSEAIGSYSSYEYFALSLPAANSLKLNEIVFVGSNNNVRCLLSATAVGAGIKTSLTASLESSRELDLSESAKESAGLLIDEAGCFDLNKISGKEYLADSRSVFSYQEINMLESIRNLVDGRGCYIDGSANPLGMYLLSIGTELFGYNAFGLRIVPLLLTLASIVLLFFLGRLCFGTDVAGLLLSLTYAVGGYSLAFATAGTVDAIYVFFVLSAFYSFVKFFKKGISNITPERSYLSLLMGGFAFAFAVAVKTQALYFGVALVIIFVFGMLRQYGAYRKRTVSLAGNDDALCDNKKQYKMKFALSLLTGIIGFVILPELVCGVSFLAGYRAFSVYYDNYNTLSYALEHIVGGFTFTGDGVQGSVLGWIVNYGYQPFGTDKYIFGNIAVAFVNLFAILYGLCHIILLTVDKGKEGLQARTKYGVIAIYIFLTITFLCGWLFGFVGTGAEGEYYAASVFASAVSVWLFSALEKENSKPLFTVKGYAVTLTRIVTAVVIMVAVVAFAFAVPGLIGMASDKAPFAWHVLGGMGG